MVTDQEVRHAIKGIIGEADTDAVIYEWNALSHDLAEWPGLFGSSRHGWIIKRSAIATEWKHGGRERPVWSYDLWFFYGFRTGKEGDNSDDEVGVILDAVGSGLKASPRLGIDDEIEKHELLQVKQNTTINCGEETLHFANCGLKVNICC